MSLTIEQFGQKIKQKYPQYNDMSDFEVGKRVLQKYPQYSDLVAPSELKRVGTITAQPEITKATPIPGSTPGSTPGSISKNDLGEKVLKTTAEIGKFLGMEPFAKGLGLLLARIPGVGKTLAPEVYELEQKIQKGTASPEEINAYYRVFVPKAVPSPRQIWGSALQTGLLTVGPAIPQLQTLRGAATIGAGIGATTGLASGLMAKKPLSGKDLLKTVAKGAILGSATQTAAYGLGKAFESLGKRLYQSIVRYNQDPKGASKVLVENRLIGTANQLKRQIDKKIDVVEKTLQEYLKDTPRNITEKQIISEALETGKSMQRSELKRFFNEKAFQENLENALEKIGLKIGAKKLNLAEVNALRREIDRKLGDKAFQKMFVELPQTKEVLMALRHGLENIVKTQKPETVSIFQQYAPLVQTSKALGQTIYHAEKRLPITFVDQILTIGGIGTGMIYPRALPYVLGTLISKKGFESGLIPSAGGALSLILADMARKGYSPAAQAVLQRIFSRFYTPSEMEKK